MAVVGGFLALASERSRERVKSTRECHSEMVTGPLVGQVTGKSLRQLYFDGCGSAVIGSCYHVPGVLTGIMSWELLEFMFC